MFDATPQANQPVDHDEKYAAAMASIKYKETRRAARGHAVMAVAEGYRSAEAQDRWLAKSARFSRHFLIVFACAAPVYLFMRVVMGAG